MLKFNVFAYRMTTIINLIIAEVITAKAHAQKYL
jgi:hypothetical protein